MNDPLETTAVDQPRAPLGRGFERTLCLGMILLVAATLRFWTIGGTSLWYDEVIPMRLARTTGPAALVELLDQIEGTRAPLHPLALQAWLRVFGPSDLSGRSLSALCGLGTVAVIYLLGRRAFNEMTGRWAAWLAAVCPPLVYYSQEAKMYAWLVLVSCISWLVFLSFRSTAKTGHCVLYWLLLTSLVYSHPLGLFMVAAHGFAFLLVWRHLKLSPRWWLTIQAALIVAIAPWIRRYMDHGTDYPMPRQPLRFLLAIPIEYIGGNSIVLMICASIIVFGIFSHEVVGRWRLPAMSSPVENLVLITWAAVPPLLMYGYSYFFLPIFGPPRYHLFSAPAYLILLAHGLSRLPAFVRWPLAIVACVLSLLLLQNYQPAMKADWRTLAVWLKNHDRVDGAGGPPTEHATIVVHPSDPRFPREEVEAARYYLSPRVRVVSADEPAMTENSNPPGRIYEVYCLSRPENPRATDPDQPNFYGLRVTTGK